MEYRTCTYIRDDGSICKSAAAKNRNLCPYHFEHRARLTRMARYRARLAAQASDSLAKMVEAASRKDAASVLSVRRRSAKPSVSTAIAPQPDRRVEAPLAPRALVPQIPNGLGS